MKKANFNSVSVLTGKGRVNEMPGLGARGPAGYTY